jgi:hypothetical protein
VDSGARKASTAWRQVATAGGRQLTPFSCITAATGPSDRRFELQDTQGA